ncbi:MAG TPA: hypothetical protein VF799_10880 [Geobacteraceae bacterium]
MEGFVPLRMGEGNVIMQKESRISVLPAVVVVVACLLSAYGTGRVMLAQQALVLQESREKLAGDAAFRDLQKVRTLSYELNGLAEQLIDAVESRYGGYQLAKIMEKIRDKGNELYFQAGPPFANNALGVVQAGEECLAARNSGDEAEKEKLLTKLKESRKRFFTEYPKELAKYRQQGMPGTIPGDALSRQVLRIMGVR